jgi:diguanylate cyclase (GGDEF)-like protein/PAS domain S-box-containing protein
VITVLDKKNKAQTEPSYQLLHEELLAAHEELTASEEELRQQFDELLANEEKIYCQNTVLNLLQDTAMGLMADHNHDTVLKEIVSGAIKIFGTPDTFVYFGDEAKETLSLKVGTGIFANITTEAKITEGLIGKAYKDGRIAIVRNYCKWEHRVSASVLDKIHYLALVPLKKQSRMFGAIGLAFSEPDRTLSEEDLSLLQRFADLASLALGNAALVASLNDEIQERKRTEEDLRLSEEKFYKTFQMNPSAVAITYPGGIYLAVNDSFCRHTGYTKEELIGNQREKVGLWADERDKRFIIEQLNQQGEVNNFETWFLRKDGQQLCGLLSARIVIINDEKCIISITHDITKQKIFKQQLKASEEKFSRAFYLSPDTITIAKVDGTYIEVNEGFTEMSGFTKEEAIGKNSVDLGIWLDPQDRIRLMEEQKKQGELRNMEVRFRHKDGHILYCQVSANLLTINDEPCYMVVARDITERVAAEKERQRQEAALLSSKNKLSSAAKLANLGSWEYDIEKNMYEFSDEFYAIYGTSAAREGRFMSPDIYAKEFLPPDDAHIVVEQLKKTICSPESSVLTNIEHRIIRRDGAVRTIAVQRDVIRDASGKIIKTYGTNQDITDRVQAEENRRQQAETIRHMAYFDSVTDLPNRQHLNEWLNREMQQTREGKAAGAVLFIDLDDLKMVNDTYGHTCGDAIIAATGSRIVEGAGEDAFVARVGGDEFIVILSGKKDCKYIEDIAYKIIKSIGQEHDLSGTHFHMTASVGIAAYPADGDTPEEIIKNADNAMYAAKHDGKNCWRFYTATMQTEAYEKIRLINGLRYALEKKEFSLVYQPQINTLQGNVAGFEALLRWNSREYGPISPMVFIPLAEQSGLIHSIGQWVMRSACLFAKQLANQSHEDLHVAVNVSSRQLAADDFIDIVCDAIKKADIQPEQLELEITESLLMDSLEDATKKLAQLNNLGVRLSLDDFGTGYSSLTYLRRLPVKTLKIDKSFIDMINDDMHGAKIIGSIINMGHTLDMTVIAEGVENQRQLEHLTNYGCDCIQGYIFSRPVPEDKALLQACARKKNAPARESL